MSKAIEVRGYRPGDEEKAVPLLDLVFNKWPRFDLQCTPEEHYVWKYLDTPYDYSCIAYATSGDEIIGSNHAIAKRVKFYDKTYRSSVGGDAAVYPDYRGKGVYTSIKDYQDNLMKDAGVHLFHAISGNPILTESTKRRGVPTLPHDFIHLIRIEDILKYVEAVRNTGQGVRRLGANILHRISALKPANKKASPEYMGNANEFNRFGPEYNDFWARISEHYDFIYERAPSYLNWRYCDPRGGAYIKAQVTEDDEVLGFVVLRINKYVPEYPEGYIVDLLALPGREDAVRALLAYSIERCGEEGANAIHYWGFSESNLTKAATEFSFHQLTKYSGSFREALISEEENRRLKELDPQRIHLSYGDHDWI
ncbi:GNAT family N-acetyltransferase [Candidatus Bathyarchaeota archaeon]|nr:GNAT family N-acetyltransferase [Candidatus Bathyarchaeota archaeon]